MFLDFTLDFIYKNSRFAKTLFKKNFKYISSSKNNLITLNLSVVLLLAKITIFIKK